MQAKIFAKKNVLPVTAYIIIIYEADINDVNAKPLYCKFISF